MGEVMEFIVVVVALIVILLVAKMGPVRRSRPPLLISNEVPDV